MITHTIEVLLIPRIGIVSVTCVILADIVINATTINQLGSYDMSHI